MEKIIIKDASFLSNVGISSKERRKKQEIGIDVELFLNIKKATQTDEIKNTVNYSEVYTLLKETVEKNKSKLIETMAQNIANKILDNFSVSKVLVRVKKPKALADRSVSYVAVEILREKNG